MLNACVEGLSSLMKRAAALLRYLYTGDPPIRWGGHPLQIPLIHQCADLLADSRERQRRHMRKLTHRYIWMPAALDRKSVV